MAIGEDKPDAGMGGKLGRSKIADWGTNAETKEATLTIQSRS